jgi:hypothetical protein
MRFLSSYVAALKTKWGAARKDKREEVAAEGHKIMVAGSVYRRPTNKASIGHRHVANAVASCFC